MNFDTVIALGREAMMTTLMIAGPMLGFGLLVGLVVSIFQAVTQIHEMTLTFIPKILAIGIAAFIFMPWMTRKLLEFAENIFINIAQYAH